MTHRRRAILAAMLILPIAAFFYVHEAPTAIDLDAMNFPFDQDKGVLTDVPGDIRKLDGKHVVLHGYMIPLDQAEHITEFALVPALFGDPLPPPPIQKTIICRVGSGLDYNPELLRVSGVFHVNEVHDEGFLVQIFEMDVDHVATSPTDAVRWPWLVPIGIAVIAAIVFFYRWFTRRRLRMIGRCVGCGYDLRATPLRCPECGRLVR